MNKSILLSIRPEWVLKILTHKKTIEVRKQFPKDYKGWVYIYCTKCKPYFYGDEDGFWVSHLISSPNPYHWNGKVVARFWCDKVEVITTKKWSPSKEQDLLKESCLTENQLFDYCNLESGKPFYAIHISKLEIFDRPRELREFKRYHEPSEHSACWKCKRFGTGCVSCSITKAPQNYCYIEGEE